MTASSDVRELVVCANIFVRMDSKYLLLKRSPTKRFAPNFVHPIGGKVDQNENPYVAAQRELMEEAGITVTNMRLEGVFLELLPHKELPVNWLIYHFSGDYVTGELRPTDEGTFVLLEKEEIAAQDLFPSVKATIDKLLDPTVGTVFTAFAYTDDGKIIETSTHINTCIV